MSQLPISPKDTPPILIGRLQAMLRGLTGDKGDTGASGQPTVFATFALADAARAAGAFTAPQVISVTADETMDGGPSLYFYDGASLGNPLIR
jgi:hypothetical protein